MIHFMLLWMIVTQTVIIYKIFSTLDKNHSKM